MVRRLIRQAGQVIAAAPAQARAAASANSSGKQATRHHRLRLREGRVRQPLQQQPPPPDRRIRAWARTCGSAVCSSSPDTPSPHPVMGARSSRSAPSSTISASARRKCPIKRFTACRKLSQIAWDRRQSASTHRPSACPACRPSRKTPTTRSAAVRPSACKRCIQCHVNALLPMPPSPITASSGCWMSCKYQSSSSA